MKLKWLSSDEVEKLLKEHWYNSIDEKTESSTKRFLKRFWWPIPWMIEIAAILSAFVQRWEDFIVIMILLFVNTLVDFYQESKALNAISILKSKLAQKAIVYRDNKWQEIDAKKLVPWDIIKIKIWDIVPADIKLLSGSDFALVDESALTGESLPKRKKIWEEIYWNAIIKQWEMVAEVIKTWWNTYFWKTVKLVAKAQIEEKSHFQKMVIKVWNFLIFLTLIMIIIILIHGYIIWEPMTELIVFSLVLTISAIPVAMPAVLTVTMAIWAKKLASKNAIVSRLAAIEELAWMEVLCSDKTGTLTQNKMSLTEPYLEWKYTKKDIMIYSALASSRENNDPIEKPIFEYIDNEKINLWDYKLNKFISFDPISKRTQWIYKNLYVTKWASQVIIELSDSSEFNKEEAYNKVKEFASKWFRTLAVAYKNTENEKYHFVWLIWFYDPPREDSKQAISLAKNNGVSVKMITWDNIEVAKYIANLLDIWNDVENVRHLKWQSNSEYLQLSEIITKAITKWLYPNKSEKDISILVDSIISQIKLELNDRPISTNRIDKHESDIIDMISKAQVFAEVYPEDKYFIVDKLQKADIIVWMTWDWVNDAPALKKADCWIAVSWATDAARAAADIVLIMPWLSIIIEAIEQAREIFERMKSYSIYRIAETIRIIIFMSLSIVVYNFYPVTAMMIIVLALLNDFPIMAIAYDNTKINKKPVRWDMKEVFILAWWLWLAWVLSSFTLFIITKSVYNLPINIIQSLFFVKLIVAWHWTIFNTRTDDWFFKKPLPSRVLFLSSIVSAIIWTIIWVYGFGFMTPIWWIMALLMWGYALIWFLFNDIVKILVIKYYRKYKNKDI